MAYLALARKWRPKTFSQVVGQQPVVKALSNALTSGRIHHAFLFTGTRGVGKTTLARIFAKSLNCEQGTSAEPCQECAVCQSIDEGRYVDLIEVDAASRTKVDDTRELLENVQYAPTSGQYKVYLIDEVHMLSGHSFNALLKTLEEPPEHVKFLFATTDPQKLPITVLSRCLQFNLRALTPTQIENQMAAILAKESIQHQGAALALLAQAADGSMRDGLSLLDQAITQSNAALQQEDVERMLGSIKKSHIVDILTAVSQNQAEACTQIVRDMAELGVDFAKALDEIMILLHDLSRFQLMGESHSSDNPAIKSLAEAISPEDVQLYYQIGLLGKRDLPLAPSQDVGFEMTLLRMLAFRPDDSQGTEIGDAQPVEQSPIEQVSSSTHSNASERQSPIQQSPVKQSPIEQSTNTAASQPETTKQVDNEPNAVEQSVPSSESSTGHSIVEVALAGNNEWGAMVEQTSIGGLTKELAMHCACERLGDDKIQLLLSPKNQYLLNEARTAEIQDAIRAVTQSSVVIDIQVEDAEIETPAECLQRLGVQQVQQTQDVLQQQPQLQSLMNEFAATINETSVKPN